jgi:hypothetical protein
MKLLFKPNNSIGSEAGTELFDLVALLIIVCNKKALK